MLTTTLATGRLLELLDATIADLETIKRHLPAAMQRLDDAEPGYPGGGHGGGNGSDDGPLRSTVIMGDDALRDRKAVAKLTHTLTINARDLLGICHRWGIVKHGHAEGNDERSRACESCGALRSMDRKVCQRCVRTLEAINDVRRTIGRPPMAQLPHAAVAHIRGDRKVLGGDVDRWARGR